MPSENGGFLQVSGLTSHNYMLKSQGDGFNMFGDAKILQDDARAEAGASGCLFVKKQGVLL